MTWKMLGAAALVLAAGACGTRESERTTGGAAAGAATGAGVGALGGPVGALAGAAIGAGAGAVTGAVTEPSTVNLGRPPWSNPEARVPLVDDNRRGTRRSRGRETAESRRARAERDRAYMGGGMVGDGSEANRSAPASGSTTGPGSSGNPRADNQPASGGTPQNR